VEERWQKMKSMVEKAMVKKKYKVRRRKIGFKDWWDRECTNRKRRLKRHYKQWRKGKRELAEIMKEKRKYRNFLEEKQKKRREEEEKELRNIKKEVEVWKFINNFINKKRGKGPRIEGEIDAEGWREHFKKLLEGEDREKGKEGLVKEEGDKEMEEDSIQEEEIREVVRKMKRRKAADVDGIPMEAWRFAERGLWNYLVKLLRQIWEEGEIPDDWRKGIVVPIYKKGDPGLPSNYRGVSLLCTAYKIYTELIRRRRLEKEVKRRKGIPETQMGFRRGRSTVDNVFILNHLVQRGKKTGEKSK